MADRNGYRGYITSRPFLSERVPQHVQNLVIRDYAARNGLGYKLSATEYVMPGCYMMLDQVLAELDVLEGIICYSIFQLPSGADTRAAVFGRILDAGAELHSAVEGFVVAERRDIGRIEDIWHVRQALARCPTSEEIKPFA